MKSEQSPEININESGAVTAELKKPNVFVRVWRFYVNGFKGMTWGKSLWVIILLKLFIMFAILRVFLFPDFLKQQAKTEEGKAQYITEQFEQRAVPTPSTPAD